jgi:hypothetical protein
MYGHNQLQGNGSLTFKQEPIHAWAVVKARNRIVALQWGVLQRR